MRLVDAAYRSFRESVPSIKTINSDSKPDIYGSSESEVGVLGFEHVPAEFRSRALAEMKVGGNRRVLG